MLVLLLLAALGGSADVAANPHLGPHLGPPLIGPPLGPPFGMLGYPPGPPRHELSPDLTPPPAAPQPPEPPPPLPPRHSPPGVVMPSLRPMQWSSLLGYHRPMDAMVDVTNELGVSVLQDYSYSRGNFAFSPYGVASVLVVLYEGARGETARQVHNVLKLPWERDVTRVGFRDIHRNLRRYFSHEGYLSGVTLSQSRTALVPEFRRVLRFYGYDVDLPPEGFNYTEAGEKGGSDRPVVTITSQQNSNRTNATETPPSNNSTEGSTTVTDASTPSTEATSTISTTVDLQNRLTSSTSPSSSSTSSRAPDEDVSMAPEMTSTTTQQNSSPLSSTTESPPSSTSSPTSTTEEANASPSAEVEAVQEAASTSGSPEEAPAPAAPLIESTTHASVGDSQENEVSGMEDQIQARIIEDPEPEPELSTTAGTEPTTLSTGTFTEMTYEPESESTTQEQDPEAEPVSTEIPELSTETPTPPPPTTVAPSPASHVQRRARLPALSFWTGLEAALAHNVSRNRRDLNDLSLQLQNGMFDSHVAVGDELFKQLARRPFLVDGSFEEPVPVMEYTATFPFAYLPRLHALAMEFPLDDERYRLLLLLPVERERHSLHHLLHGLSHVTLREVQRALRPRRLHAVVPAFMVEGFVILTPTLQQLGIWDMFDPRRADLSGMTEDPDLYVRNIEQAVTVVIKNYVEILDIQTRTTAARSHLDQFVATHPFLYFVMDSETQVALMAGKVVDPLNSRIY